ncbi:MAG: substrate-binding domain-containing protein [Kiritimatiellia bacterium]
MEASLSPAGARRVLLLFCPLRKSSRDRFAGVLRYNLRTNWELSVLQANFSETPDKTLLAELKRFRPHGIVHMAGAGVRIDAALRRARLAERPVRIAFEHRRTTPGSAPDGSVCIDNESVVRAALETFRRRGLAHFAYASTLTRISDPHVAVRLEAFNRLAHPPKGVAATLVAPARGALPDVARIAQWLARLPKPCGVLLFNDQTALPVYAACRQAGLTTPGQIFLLGVDNDTMVCDNMNPGLSSILPDFERSGFFAASLLDRCFRQGDAPRGTTRIEYGVASVIERASTMDTSGASRYVLRAREYIEHHPGERLTVGAIAHALNLSPRLLEKHFAACAGRTLQAELLDRRFARLRELLVTTDRPVSELIDMCGWNSISSAKRIFKARYGETMRAWRASGGDSRHGPATSI